MKIRRPPDFEIGPQDDVYLRRWNIIRTRWFSIYLHNFLRSDDDRAMHDHRYDNVSLLLVGRYIEVTPHGEFLRRPFWPVFRRAESPHRVNLIDNQPVWSLFFMGRRRREWGFHCPRGWRHWREFVADTANGNKIGRGCDD